MWRLPGASLISSLAEPAVSILHPCCWQPQLGRSRHFSAHHAPPRQISALGENCEQVRDTGKQLYRHCISLFRVRMKTSDSQIFRTAFSTIIGIHNQTQKPGTILGFLSLSNIQSLPGTPSLAYKARPQKLQF